MKRMYAIRRTIAVLTLLIVVAIGIAQNPDLYQVEVPSPPATEKSVNTAVGALGELEVKGRASKTGYSRDQFGDGWNNVFGCDTRNEILRRDLISTVVNAECKVVSGILKDPYTGNTVQFERGSVSSQAVQIDHVVALSDAWQKGAQQLSYIERVRLANDPLNLLAVDGAANQQKSDGDAATWLPSNKAFRCQYVSRQVKVKMKYELWITSAEKEAINHIASHC